MATDGGGKASRLRWLYVVRCAVAFVVTVIAVVVVVRAVVVMLRPGELQLKVACGHVSVDNIPSMPPPRVIFRLALTAYNPSRRAFTKFSGVNIRLIESAPAAARSNITEFNYPPNVSLPRQVAEDSIVTVGLTPPEDIPMSYVQELFDGRSISAEMVVDGLLTDRLKGVSTHVHHVMYFCWPVNIAVGGYSSSLSSTCGDTTCFDNKIDAVRIR